MMKESKVKVQDTEEKDITLTKTILQAYCNTTYFFPILLILTPVKTLTFFSYNIL